MEPLEGYYVETIEGLIFAVKGLHHPKDGVIAYLRYLPDKRGQRIREGRVYKRLYDLQETTECLKRRYPQYLRWFKELGLRLQFVPFSRIERVYNPKEMLREILERPHDEIERKIGILIQSLVQEAVPLKDIGLTGSRLIQLATNESDIDLVIYGRKNGLKAYKILRRLRKRGFISELPFGEALKVAKERWDGTGLDIQRLVDLERGKLLHGLLEGTQYFIRLVPNPWEVKPPIRSRPLGVVRIRGIIVKDDESIYTPCLYRVRAHTLGRSINELMSYRGKFTEQARSGERFEARGTLEEVHSSRGIYYRLMMGDREDYLIPLRLLGAI